MQQVNGTNGPNPAVVMAQAERSARELKVAEFADGLRQMADWYVAHPYMPLPAVTSFYFWEYEREQFLRMVQLAALGGKVVKAVKGEGESAEYQAVRNFGPVALDIRIPRVKVCRLVREAVYDCPDSLLEAAAEYTGTERGQ